MRDEVMDSRLHVLEKYPELKATWINLAS